MVYEDIDAGDETHRHGDTVSYPHPDGDGTDLDSVTLGRGEPVAYDGTDLQAVTGDGTDEVAGILSNYDVSGDTGKEVVGPEATVLMDGTVKADLSVYANGSASVSVGSTVDDAGHLYVMDELDASNNLYEVRVR